MFTDFLPQLRYDISGVASILRLSRATLYQRIRVRLIATQKDGRRTNAGALDLPAAVVAPPKLKSSSEVSGSRKSELTPDRAVIRVDKMAGRWEAIPRSLGQLQRGTKTC